jgi:ASC-1-like (ASCH) protein
MKYTIEVHEFSFNKVKYGARKIGIHLLDKKAQMIKLHDILDMCNISTNEHLECEVKGIALFDNFSDMIDALGPQPLGYDNKDEIMLRLNRIFPPEAQEALNAVAFFIEPHIEKLPQLTRGEIER